MTLKTGVMMLKIQLCITGINYTYIINMNLKYICLFKIENGYFKLYTFFTILLFYCIFDQINTVLMSIRDLFQKYTKKS